MSDKIKIATAATADEDTKAVLGCGIIVGVALLAFAMLATCCGAFIILFKFFWNLV